MQILSARQVIFRIAIIISIAELLIMLVLGNLEYKLNIYTEALIDTLALAVLSTPAIYLWVIKPYIRARDEALEYISRLAFTDTLTQLANRRQLMVHLQMFLASSQRHKFYGALLLIDLNKFKPINDQYGHDAGDAVLVDVALRLQDQIRAEDAAGRFGGDEFMVLLAQLETDRQQAINEVAKVTQRILTSLREPISFKGESLQISASIGICMLGPDSPALETVIKQADEAMYQAKHGGSGVVVFQADPGEPE